MKPCRKKRHPTRDGAVITKKRMKHSGLDAYFCKSCKAWHLGTSNDPYRKAQRINELLDRVLGC